MSLKRIYIDSIGEVLLKKNRRSKKISIRITPFKGIVVSLPYYASYKAAEKFVESKIE